MTNHQEDLKDISALFAKLSEAWNKGDGELYGSCFTEDAEYVTFMGQHLKGRKQIADVHQMLFAGPLKGTVLVSSATTDLQPRFITPDVAVVIAIGEARLAVPAQDSNDRGSINTNVIVKQNGEWKLTAFQNSRIQEMPRGAR
ncbi:SgcJ/EcaC family oxidoreductase [Paenibacillus sp. KQZ6P-2]|uniref:SgcJ/EcaC family oxidoreductase n=1 Tax=Paenibacillus mangrovi TaxID=2931978 RepID=A0A9X1WJB4_9BACL|nr:SgcJ/EcaC family oxidoreductase [Paenibacillus mangrovi]MCJ8010417.1 SgcJ/EcaC family oxidoreductase [Paenibacillus mangrovi]